MDSVNTKNAMCFCAGVVTLMSTLLACDSKSDQQLPLPPGTSLSVPVIAPPNSAVEAGNEAVAAYLGMWQDFAAASHTSDWRSASLGVHATGTALTTMTRGLYADHANGLVSKGEPRDDPKVSSAQPAGAPVTVVLTDCGDDRGWRHYRVKDGALADTGPNGRRQINAVVQKQRDGAWRVVTFGVQAVGTC